MPDTQDLEMRIAALEAEVRELRQAVQDLRKALPATGQPPTTMLRSQGMIDRPRTGK